MPAELVFDQDFTLSAKNRFALALKELGNVVDQAQALHMLKAEGVSIRPADLVITRRT